MTHVLRAQARIAATTRIAVPGVLAMAAFVVLTGLAPAVLFGHHQDPHTVLERGTTVAAVTAMLLGALQTPGDLNNGMTRAVLLVEPQRLRLLGAQLLVSLALGAGVGAAAALLADSKQDDLGTIAGCSGRQNRPADGERHEQIFGDRSLQDIRDGAAALTLRDVRDGRYSRLRSSSSQRPTRKRSGCFGPTLSRSGVRSDWLPVW